MEVLKKLITTNNLLRQYAREHMAGEKETLHDIADTEGGLACENREYHVAPMAGRYPAVHSGYLPEQALSWSTRAVPPMWRRKNKVNH